MIRATVCALLLIQSSNAFSHNNSLSEFPMVECGPEEILIRGSTAEPFTGVVYVKNWRRSPRCVRNFAQASTQPQHSIPLNDLASCGLEIRRKADDKELEIFGVFVFSFHPNFVTMGDRAFAVHCTFKEQDRQVDAGFDLRNLTTKATLGRTARTPNVRLAILRGPDGGPAKTVSVGDPLHFRFSLPQPSSLYGIRVRDCVAETVAGRQAKVLEDGCSLDPIAISHITYSEDHSQAFASAMAFKFADSEDVWFKCDVSVCLLGSVPSYADSEEYCGKPKECKRRSRRETETAMGRTIEPTLGGDVIEHRLFVLDKYNQRDAPARLPNHQEGRRNGSSGVSRPRRAEEPWRLCVRRPIFALLSSIILILYASTAFLAALAAFLYCQRRSVDSR